MRVQVPSSVLTKLISGDTVAEFMYSSFVKSTVTSAPFIFSDRSRSTGREKEAGRAGIADAAPGHRAPAVGARRADDQAVLFELPFLFRHWISSSR